MDTTQLTPRLFDTRAAEHYTAASRSELYRAMKAGELVGLKVGGRRYFTRQDLDAWVDARIAAARRSA